MFCLDDLIEEMINHKVDRVNTLSKPSIVDQLKTF